MVQTTSEDTARVVIVGAGVGGLTLAARLAASGARVVLLERATHVGGKMRQVSIALPEDLEPARSAASLEPARSAASLDAGPTVLTMRWVLDELFRDVGERLEEHLDLAPLDVLARHVWRDGSTLDLHADPARSAEAIRELAGAREAEAYRAFCAYSAEIYRTVEGPFLRSPMPSVVDFFRQGGLRKAAAVTKIDAMRSMWKAIEGHFRDERLRMLFGRYATYTGSSPWRAPATLNTIAAVEQQGAWVARGGMYAVARALRTLCERRGVEIRTGVEVARVMTSGGRATGVELVSGEQIRAAAVAMNGDAADLPRLLEPSEARRAPAMSPADRSLSAVVVTALVHEADGSSSPGLAHHNVFFSGDYRAEFDALFDRGEHPEDPTVYLCAQDRGPFGRGDVPDGFERVLLLVNAPANGDQPLETSEKTPDPWASKIPDVLARSGLKLHLVAPHTTTPRGFERMFPSTGGALYGPASHGMTSAFSRAPARSAIPGLYVVGGSAHPGAGVPMVALSASLAARAISEDLGSILRSPTTATPGGTSTRSATASATR